MLVIRWELNTKLSDQIYLKINNLEGDNYEFSNSFQSQPIPSTQIVIYNIGEVYICIRQHHSVDL